VPNDRFVSVAAGNNHFLAMRADGSVAGWGLDVLGSTHAPSGVRFTAIAAGVGYSIGIDDHGTIKQWGDPAGGIGSVPTGRFVAIGAGARHAAALRYEGKVK
jgi:alpha-tubulin suppressor-like RCC1 family protein